jgi:DNA mismatch repair protein MutL
MPDIRRLSPETVNRIAAGEVVERPGLRGEGAGRERARRWRHGASTSPIEGRRPDPHRGGGRRLRHGAGDQLATAIERHATSKLPGGAKTALDDLLNIASMGFRGEALPSIGSVARLTITTQDAKSWARPGRCSVEGGAQLRRTRPPHGAGPAQGTRVEVADLFYATPARLKFLKSGAGGKQQRSPTSSSAWRWRRADVGFFPHQLRAAARLSAPPRKLTPIRSEARRGPPLRPFWAAISARTPCPSIRSARAYASHRVGQLCPPIIAARTSTSSCSSTAAR